MQYSKNDGYTLTRIKKTRTEFLMYAYVRETNLL